MVNLSAFIRFHASRAPERIAIVYKGERITYARALRRSRRWPAGWRAAASERTTSSPSS